MHKETREMQSKIKWHIFTAHDVVWITKVVLGTLKCQQRISDISTKALILSKDVLPSKAHVL